MSRPVPYLTVVPLFVALCDRVVVLHHLSTDSIHSQRCIMHANPLSLAVLHVGSDLHSGSSSKQSLERSELGLLKFALCGGLYPHFAAPDRFNHFRKVGEQVFHTASNQQVLMHPSSSLQAYLAGVTLHGTSGGAEGGYSTGVDTLNQHPTCDLFCFMKVHASPTCFGWIADCSGDTSDALCDSVFVRCGRCQE